MKKKILVTGCAGFIGYHVAKKLIKKNYYVIGIDNTLNVEKKAVYNKIQKRPNNPNSAGRAANDELGAFVTDGENSVE